MDGRSILVACDLPHPIRVTRTVLGSVQSTAIDGVATDIYWASVAAGPLKWPELSSPAVLDGPALPADWELVTAAEWGIPLGIDLPDYRVTSAEVHRVVLAPRLALEGSRELDLRSKFEPIMAWLRAHLNLWLTAVVEWIEVITGQVGAPEARATQTPRFGDGVHVWLRDNSAWTEPQKWSWSGGPGFTMDKPVWGSNADLVVIGRALTHVANSVSADADQRSGLGGQCEIEPGAEALDQKPDLASAETSGGGEKRQSRRRRWRRCVSGGA